MSKDNRLDYFKNNYQDPTDDEFDPTQYYYKRTERNSDLEFEGIVNGMTYDTSQMGINTNPSATGAPFQNRFNGMQPMSGIGTQAALGSGINLPGMYGQQNQQVSSANTNNNMSSWSRIMMPQQVQNGNGGTSQQQQQQQQQRTRMMTSPIRNQNSGVMLNGPMGHPGAMGSGMEAYRTDGGLMGMMNANNEQSMYAPTQQQQMFTRNNADVRLLMQQQMMEQQRLQLQQQTQQGISSMNASDGKYGLMGLRNVIKMTDQDLNVLALGFDLTTLGLNLNSPEYLYSSFASPWSDRPSHIVPEFKIPSCYMRAPIPLKEWQIKKFKEETLFYIFYSMPRDQLQFIAARELISRNWLYHKEQKIWFIQASNGDISQAGDKKNTFVYFDPTLWKTLSKDNFVVELDKVMQLSDLNVSSSNMVNMSSSSTNTNNTNTTTQQTSTTARNTGKGL